MNKTKNEVKVKKTYDVEASMKSSVNVMFTQIQATRSFNLFRDPVVAAMIKELKQLEEGAMPGKIVPEIDPDILSTKNKAMALNAMNLIKQKRDGTIKGRTCANGSNQKIYLGK